MDDYADLAEIEAKLYAQVHHESADEISNTNNFGQTTADNFNFTAPHKPTRLVTDKAIINNGGGNGVAKAGSSGRYCYNNKQPHNKKSTNFVRGVNPFSQKPNLTQKIETIVSPTNTADTIRPKTFTPYTSYLSQIGSQPSEESVQKDSGNVKKEIYGVVAKTDSTVKAKAANKTNPNPFTRENKMKKAKKMRLKRDKAQKTRQNQKQNKSPVSTIVLTSSSDDEDENVKKDDDFDGDNDDDDDVVVIPTPAPPLVCIESSSDSEADEEQTNDDPKPSTSTADDPVKHIGENDITEREVSPAASTISEDFIGQNDRNRVLQSNRDPFLGLDDEDLHFINQTVDQALKHSEAGTNVLSESGPSSATGQSSDTSVVASDKTGKNASNDIIFATPTRASANDGKRQNKSYEVAENCFAAAVDVYESESSDFPESVYGKGEVVAVGKAAISLNNSESDVSDIEINTSNRSKRMRKRKSSGSNKGSDYICSDESEVELDPNGAIVTSTPYIMRGDAVPNAVTKSNKSKRSKRIVEPQSDEEFISQLSCIVHNEKTNADVDSSKSLDEAVVETAANVLATNEQEWIVTDEVGGDDVPSAEEDMDAEQTDFPSDWIVKDQVGDTDLFKAELLPAIGDNADKDDETINLQLNISSSNTNKVIEPSKIVEKPREEASLRKKRDKREPIKRDEKDKNCVKSISLFDNDPEILWNDEMKYFYHNSWGGEMHNIRGIQKNMPNALFEWTVSNEDKFPKTRNSYKNLRCLNCREFGHKMAQCSKPPKRTICHMCGQIGHREPRCPNSICLRCGSKCNIYSRGCSACNHLLHMMCLLCKSKGHTAVNCPDKWRRYHSTIEPNVPINKVIKSNPKPKSCCICAGFGHTADRCRNVLRILNESVPSTFVHSHSEMYVDEPARNDKKNEAAPFALMSIPRDDFKFNWDINDDAGRFYGRFLKYTKFNKTQTKSLDSSQNPSKKPKLDVRAEQTAKLDVRAEQTASVEHVDEKQRPSHDLVINPMNVINNKEKSKKKFTKNFFEDGAEKAIVLNDTIDALNDSVIFVVDQSNIEPVSSASSKTSTIVKDKCSDDLEKSIVSKMAEIRKKSSEFSFIEQFNELHNKQDDRTFDLSFINNEKVQKSSSNGRNVDRFPQKRPENKPQSKPSNRNKSSNNEVRKMPVFSFNEKVPQSSGPLTVTLSSNKGNRMVFSRDQTTPMLHEDDSNYSFSDYFVNTDQQVANKQTMQRDHGDIDERTRPSKVEDKDERLAIKKMKMFEEYDKLPEFIPLSSSTSSKYDQRSTEDKEILSIVQGDGTANIQLSTDVTELKISAPTSGKCDAKIYLTKEHCKFLLTDRGNSFLYETSAKHGVRVNMEFRSVGNILIVNGYPLDQDNFHSELIKFCEEYEEQLRKKNEISQLVPRQKHTLIKFIKDQLLQLDQPLGSVKDLFIRMRINERQKTKTGLRNADKARKLLNMILMGQYGLRDGRMHSTELQNNLRFLVENPMKDVVTRHFRHEVFQHFRYIFSSYEHGDYAELIHEYDTQRKNNELTLIDLDRSLVGLKIKVIDDGSVTAVSNEIVPTHLEATKIKSVVNVETVAEIDQIIDSVKAKPAPAEQVGEKITTKISTSTQLLPPPPPLLIPSSPDVESSKNINVASVLWSRKCEEFIAKCRGSTKLRSNKAVKQRLNALSIRAKASKISYNEYRTVMKVFEGEHI